MRRRMLTGEAVAGDDAAQAPFAVRPPEDEKPQVFVGQVTSPVSAMAVSLDGRTLATGMTRSNTILLWPLNDPGWSDYPPVQSPNIRQIESWWSDLAGLDAAAAYRAIWFLAACPASTEAFLAEEFRASEEARGDTEAIALLVAQVNSDDADQRDEARERLLVLGAAAEPILRSKMRDSDDAGAKRRFESIIGLLQSPVQRTAGEPLRRIRLVQLLEQLDTENSRQLLATIARGSKTARETRDARAALVRLEATGAGP